ncbi:hypothetical protein IDJ77_05005 [Mucilaginibacter sp. ZT4R22]|uniref:Uncharacterized protein n=1 Tax=Mucilaginibacter pankratovii TaxID=2772110 RepID=A0ABR7WLG1_9SPHI|nr:hypothetical protein [Mucilaginibacter pankratovii]MBD1363164.1 hypothetical protein [Mucilaginibacter pankratovii]
MATGTSISGLVLAGKTFPAKTNNCASTDHFIEREPRQHTIGTSVMTYQFARHLLLWMPLKAPVD